MTYPWIQPVSPIAPGSISPLFPSEKSSCQNNHGPYTNKHFETTCFVVLPITKCQNNHCFPLRLALSAFLFPGLQGCAGVCSSPLVRRPPKGSGQVAKKQVAGRAWQAGGEGNWGESEQVARKAAVRPLVIGVGPLPPSLLPSFLFLFLFLLLFLPCFLPSSSSLPFEMIPCSWALPCHTPDYVIIR
ncbi:hypothetical protein B0J11DRAFT_301759 [Dendryphion nanum]|uniref:Uncharacterized protein n=1 Tax=Dendryphion nanum TaxID=256645 RepID=A0A9P9IN88_9PLEO|nr:hypothetical protein B0J11DRAFT_301759 [Dendryphion nanum]